MNRHMSDHLTLLNYLCWITSRNNKQKLQYRSTWNLISKRLRNIDFIHGHRFRSIDYSNISIQTTRDLELMFWAQKHQRWECGGGEESIKAETIWPWMAIRRNLYREVYCFNSFERETVQTKRRLEACLVKFMQHWNEIFYCLGKKDLFESNLWQFNNALSGVNSNFQLANRNEFREILAEIEGRQPAITCQVVKAY